MAARSLKEVLEHPIADRRLGLALTLPEKNRKHPALASRTVDDLVLEIESAVGRRFALKFLAGQGGAGVVEGIEAARNAFRRGDIEACVVGGVDSLVNDLDISRLRRTGRMLEPDLPEGLIPGEGSAFVLLAPADRFPGALARLFGVSSATESDHVDTPRFSQGRALAEALRLVVQDGGIPESNLSFRVSTVNGERYAVWESMFSTTRFYRTRRDRLTTWYTASSLGELGAASGAIALVLVALAIAGGYAPGPYAICESASDNGLRAAFLVGPSAGAATPPFRPEEGASIHLLRKRLEWMP
jgi:3-oxoacyl-[acyl-carrier-protein] synthase-1